MGDGTFLFTFIFISLKLFFLVIRLRKLKIFFSIQTFGHCNDHFDWFIAKGLYYFTNIRKHLELLSRGQPLSHSNTGSDMIDTRFS